MGNRSEQISNWLKSKDVERELKISSCDLMHLRIEGSLSFIKNGNSFLYSNIDVEKIKTNSKIG